MAADLRSTVSRVAHELGVKTWAVQKWWQRGGVPPKWRKPVLDKLSAEGWAIDWDDLGNPVRAPQPDQPIPDFPDADIEPEPDYRRLYLIAEQERGLLLLDAADRTSGYLLGFAIVGICGAVSGFLLCWLVR
jgi:hypothetical protein